MGDWPVVCMVAQKRNGKGEAAEYLTRRLNEKCLEMGAGKMMWRQKGFSDPIKNMVGRFFGLTREFIEEWKSREEKPEGFKMNMRQALVLLANSFREVREEVWIENLFKEISQPTVINDGRFPLELNMAKEYGAINILVWRPGYENSDEAEAEIREVVNYFKNKLPMGGKVEKDLIGSGIPMGASAVDFFVVNDGNLEDFYKKLEELVLPLIEENFPLSKKMNLQG